MHRSMLTSLRLLFAAAVCLALFPAAQVSAECIWGQWSDNNGNHYCPPDCGGNPACESITPPLPPPPPQPDPSVVAYNRAYNLAKAGDLKKAAKNYLEALKYDNRYAAAHNNLANIYLTWGQYQRATDHYLKAIQYAPTNTDRELYRNNLKNLYLHQGYRNLKNGDFASAESYFRSVLGMFPSNRDAVDGLDEMREREAVDEGNARHKLKDYDGAIASYRKALGWCRRSCDYINRNIAYSQRNRESAKAEELFDREDFEGAIRYSRAALTYCRPDMDCEYLRNNIAAAENNLENRKRRQVRERRRQENDVLMQKARGAANSGDLRRAEGYIRELMHQNPDDNYYDNELGNNLLAQKRYKDAVKAYRVGLRKNRNDATMHYNLSLALQGQGHFKEAEQEVQKALSIDPSYKNAKKIRGQLKGRERDLSNRRLVANAKKMMGDGDFRQAEAKLREIISQDPGNDDAIIALGNGLLDKRRLGEAADLYREGLKHNPDNVVILYNLAVILERQGRYGQAEEELRKILKIDPSDKLSQEMLGDLEDKGFIARKVDPIISPAFGYLEKSLIAANDRRKKAARSVLATYDSVMEQASSAEYHGLMARDSKGWEEAKKLSNKVFDTPGDNIGRTLDRLLVDGRKPERADETPKELLASPRWKQLETAQRKAAAIVDKKEKELANLQAMRESPEIKSIKKAMILVGIANTKTELFEAEREVKVIEKEKSKLRKSYKLGAITEREENSKKTGETASENE